tara:strand:- start:90 stop:401 length:312 start_codon:yes stop_codon:yes gene_type:complete
MARYLEYKLHAPMNGHGMSTPNFITNGGHWYNDNKMIGVEPDTTEYYVPETVNVLTVDQLKARQVAVHAVTPYKKMDESGHLTDVDMSDAEVETMVADWAAAQ